MSLFEYITKQAKSEEHGTGIPSMKAWFKPYAHQKEAIDKLIDNNGKMILAHQMGTGKTVTSIYGFEKLKHKGKAKKALVVVPSGLRNNFASNGVAKFTDSSYQVVASSSEKGKANYARPDKISPDKDYTIMSYAMFRRDPVGYMKKTGADTLILDEYHKVRNERSGVFKAAVEARPYAKNFIGLTASLINNHPSEIASLLTISEANRGMSPSQFKKAFTQTIGHTKSFSGKANKVVGLKNPEGFVKTVTPRVHYVTTEDLKGKTMPTKEVRDVKVPMSKDQYRLYQLALNKLGPMKKYITKKDENITVKDANQLFVQIAQARRLANSVHTGRKNVTPAQSAEITPKVKRVLDDTKQHLESKSDNKVVLYSNLIKGGIDVLSAGLTSRGIPHALFVGKGTEVGGNKVTSEVRQAGVKDFKAGDKRVIVISGAGAEGLDLKNATAFYALDGHFNPERILQAEARARRLGGQSARPVEQRKVDVRRYQSTVPDSEKPGVFGRMLGKKAPQTTDEWMYGVAGQKRTTSKQFYGAMQKPHKYIRKYRTASGEIRYVYPKDHQPKPRGGFMAKVKNFFGSKRPTEPKSEQSKSKVQ